MNEFTVKTAFTVLLFNDVNYAIYSEPELSRGYADLCLILRPDARPYRLHDLLFEFKYVGFKTIGLNRSRVQPPARLKNKYIISLYPESKETDIPKF